MRASYVAFIAELASFEKIPFFSFEKEFLSNQKYLLA